LPLLPLPSGSAGMVGQLDTDVWNVYDDAVKVADYTRNGAMYKKVVVPIMYNYEYGDNILVCTTPEILSRIPMMFVDAA